MTRTTIDYGIDLGTTNSEIAVFIHGEGRKTEVIKNNEGFEHTPSAVRIDAKGRLYIGQRAKDRAEDDPENTKIEFKRQMGKAEPFEFKATGRKMKPEELSAEVLKELKKNVEERKGETITAAVITVPADFDAAAIEATNRAARLAGLTISPLLQEPVAAAMAYGFQSNSDNVRWLVYDFGGGTFDAAIIHVRDGIIRVENHGGDKYLGGKDIDYAIVDNLLAPAVRKRFSVSDFYRGNEKYRADFAKLKNRAEEAKIRLSRSESEIIDLSDLSVSRGQQADFFDFELRRSDLERLAEPLIVKSINICRDVLKQSRLGPGDIEKVLLVGGPTLMPYLRERLADKTHGLGIPLEFRVDPFTVVAQGAAVFAATQPLIDPGLPKPGEYKVNLDYKAIGPDTDPLVSGQVISATSEDLSMFTIEFVNKEARPPWRSGKVGLTPDGRFMATLFAEKGHDNTFFIELKNAAGVRQKTIPESFPYTVSSGIPDKQILMHSIGVATADGKVQIFFNKGQPLPAIKRDHMKTTVDVRAGRSQELIRVPVVEGENKRADRNEIVGALEVKGDKFKRDVPAGSEIEVKIAVDESQRYHVKGYIPLLDEEFEATFIKTLVVPNPDELEKLVRLEKKRLAELREKARKTKEAKALELLARIDSERLEHEIDRALAASHNSQDDAGKCASRLRDLQIKLDEVEESLRWPELVSEAEKEIEFATKIVSKHGNNEQKKRLTTLIQEVRDAIQQGDEGLLQSRKEELSGFCFSVWRTTSEFWVELLGYIESKRDILNNQAEADRLFSMAVHAINTNNFEGLQAAVRQLMELLPREERVKAQSSFGSLGSTVQRA